MDVRPFHKKILDQKIKAHLPSKVKENSLDIPASYITKTFFTSVVTSCLDNDHNGTFRSSIPLDHCNKTYLNKYGKRSSVPGTEGSAEWI